VSEGVLRSKLRSGHSWRARQLQMKKALPGRILSPETSPSVTKNATASPEVKVRSSGAAPKEDVYQNRANALMTDVDGELSDDDRQRGDEGSEASRTVRTIHSIHGGSHLERT